jgi:hypothetical protein
VSKSAKHAVSPLALARAPCSILERTWLPAAPMALGLKLATMATLPGADGAPPTPLLFA